MWNWENKRDKMKKKGLKKKDIFQCGGMFFFWLKDEIVKKK